MNTKEMRLYIDKLEGIHMICADIPNLTYAKSKDFESIHS